MNHADEIYVRSGKTGFSFSKGILSQSLLAAAIDAQLAFEIAREIEQSLVARNIREIERDSLRELTHQAVSAAAGEEAAARYLLWRENEASGTPVILLLGGTSGVGKTTLALEVARRLGIGRVLSTDSIRQVMRLMVSRDLMPWIHTSSFDAFRVMEDEKGRTPSVIAGFRAQAVSVGVGVRASIDRSVEERANLVVDGVSLLPGAIDPVAYEGRAVVVSVILATLEESLLKARFEARAIGQPMRLASRYLEELEGILEIQRYLIGEGEHRGIPVIDNLDVDHAAEQVIAQVLDRVRAATERSGARPRD